MTCECLKVLDDYQAELEAKAENAFNRNKWGMFAYYKSQAVHIRRVMRNIKKGSSPARQEGG